MTLPWKNISSDFDYFRAVSDGIGSDTKSGAASSAFSSPPPVTKVCIRDLYTKEDIGPVDITATGTLDATVLPHDSVFFCIRPASANGDCKSYGGCPHFAT